MSESDTRDEVISLHYKFGKELICEAQELTLAKEDDNSKKRKRTAETATESAVVEIDLTFIDE